MIKTSPLAPLGSARGTEMGGALRAGGAEAGEAHLHLNFVLAEASGVFWAQGRDNALQLVTEFHIKMSSLLSVK